MRKLVAGYGAVARGIWEGAREIDAAGVRVRVEEEDLHLGAMRYLIIIKSSVIIIKVRKKTSTLARCDT